MNKYNTNQFSETSTLALAGILATGAFATSFPQCEQSIYEAVIPQPYQYARQNSTHSRTVFVVADQIKSNLEKSKKINQFFSQLAASQETLNSDAAQILHDNLWDLYSR